MITPAVGTMPAGRSWRKWNVERRISKAELLAVYDWDAIRQRILGALKKLGRDMPIVPEDEVGAEEQR